MDEDAECEEINQNLKNDVEESIQLNNKLTDEVNCMEKTGNFYRFNII